MKNIYFTITLFITATSFAQIWNYDSKNMIYSNANTVTIGSNPVGTYGPNDRSLEVSSDTYSVLVLRTGTENMVLSNHSIFPSGFYLPGTKAFNFFVNSLTVPSLQLQTNGNVSIGRSASPAAYKLAVAGRIIAEELKVQLQANWPDYVFKPEYNLPSLAEVARHIEEKGHLPEIPSASEVMENGIEVGEMNRLLLQKVEELTLYIIEEHKQNENQNRRINELQAKIDMLKQKQ